MRKRRRIHQLVLSLAIVLSLLAACSAQRGRTERYDGFTVRTEKSEEAEPPSEPESLRNGPERGEEEDYVLNKSSMKFHYPDCSGAEEIRERNRLDYHGTRESVLSMGYEPCKLCNP